MNPESDDKSLPSAASKIADNKSLERYRKFLLVQTIGMAPRLRQKKLDASDLVQQTLLDAHQSLDQFRGSTEAEMANWLSRMLANNITDAIRAMQRKKRDVSRECELDAAFGTDARGPADWIPAEQTSPSLGALKSEQFLQIAEAISELPESQQEVIVLHHLQGHSLAEVATLVDRTQSSVAGLLYRGLKRLREMLA